LIQAISSDKITKAAGFSAAFSLCALHFAPALSSISMILFFLCLLLQYKRHYLYENKNLVLFALGWCIWQFMVQFSLGYDQEAIRKTLLRLPLLFLPLIWLVKPQFSRDFVVYPILFAGLFHTWIGGASVINYFAHYRFLNQMVLESKPLPLFSSVYHIEFSLIMAVVCLLQLSFSHLTNHGWQRVMMLLSLSVNLISLHILSARTGIMAFWVGVPFMFSVIQLPIWLKGKGKWWLLLLPLLLVLCVPSLRNRMINTVEDLTAVSKNENLSDKSFGRRWESWKIAIEVIKENPLIGVGFSGVENALQQGFERKKSYLHVTDRIQPHNQFLQLGMQSGVITVILFFAMLIMLFCSFILKQNFTGLSVLTALMVSMMFESYLERQSGVAIFIVALFFVLFPEKKEQHFH
jgi:O-antigen ligase